MKLILTNEESQCPNCKHFKLKCFNESTKCYYCDNCEAEFKEEK